MRGLAHAEERCGVPLENVDPALMDTAVSMPFASR